MVTSVINELRDRFRTVSDHSVICDSGSREEFFMMPENCREGSFGKFTDVCSNLGDF
jgi:hypothetical protein